MQTRINRFDGHGNTLRTSENDSDEILTLDRLSISSAIMPRERAYGSCGVLKIPLEAPESRN